MFSVTENESYTNLLDPNKYERIVEEPEIAQTEKSEESYTRKGFYAVNSPNIKMTEHILRCGSNEPESLERIAAQYQKDKSTEENAEFLKKEFGEGGRGYIVNDESEHKLSAWFDESGITYAVSETAFPDGRRAHISWAEAAERISNMLDNGTYCSQDIIDRARDYELTQIGRGLTNLYQDTENEYRPYLRIPEEYFNEGYSRSEEIIAEAMKDKNQLNSFIEGLTDFVEKYRENRDIMRFHFHKPDELLAQLKDLQLDRKDFRTKSDFTFAPKYFITEDEKDYLVARGSGVSGGKFRIDEFFRQEHSAKEKADFLKDEYGTGGSGRRGFNTSHDSKGLKYSKGISYGNPDCEITLGWSMVAKRIDRLVSNGVYITSKDISDRIKNAQYDISHRGYSDTYDKNIIDNAMKILDQYGICNTF